MTCGGCERRRKAIAEAWRKIVNNKKRKEQNMSGTANSGMKGSPPVISIASAPSDAKRQGEFYVNDVRTTINQLNNQIAKAASVGISIEIDVGVDQSGVTELRLTSAERK